MTKTTTTSAWITLRATEPEFMAFLKADSPQKAIAAATARCADAHGEFQESAISSLKADYLKYAREAMGLPANAGTF